MPSRARTKIPEGSRTIVRPDWRVKLERERFRGATGGQMRQEPERRGVRARIAASLRGFRARTLAPARGFQTRAVASLHGLPGRVAGARALLRRDWREDVQARWSDGRAWVLGHRVLVGGIAVVALFATVDAVPPRQMDSTPTLGAAQRIPVAYPLQVQADPETSERDLAAIENGERLREQEVVAAASQATLDRAKAEAAAAVAGQAAPWLGDGAAASLPGGIESTLGGYALPARGVFSSGYGMRWGGFHYGIDIAAPIGSPIYAVAAGTVIDAGPAQGFGLWVRIRHDDGTISVYGHMYDFSVSVGERVRAGQQIARIGNRGDSTGPHLHFEILVNGQHVDPLPWLAFHGIKIT
ncbi:murein DD-endopeptidase MepM/ murein hydrolase activator NlpD [Nocardia sp. GAS34]